jgi:ABC-2 type transport system ATP-binding protein
MVIEARGLTKCYGPVRAVDDLSFDVRPGHVTGFVGPNGSGKTTTMRLILGLDAPDAGSVTVNGRRYAQLRFPLHQVGALLESRALHPARRAYDHLLAQAQANRIPARRVDEVLAAVGLSDVARRRAGAYSLGMAQRLGIAAALLGDPPVLLFDEPVNGLDPEGILWIRQLLKRLAAEGRTVFVSSHLMSEMALTAEHLVVIGKGRLVADTTVDALVTRGAPTVRLRSPARDRLAAALWDRGATVTADGDALVVVGFDAAAVGDLAAELGVAVHELVPQRTSLEEAFFDITDEAAEFRAAGVGGRGGAP